MAEICGRVFCGSCIFVFMRACYPVPLSLVSGASSTVHTRVDVELRVVGQQVAVNMKNPNRPWVHNLGPQQKSTFLPWTGVPKGGLGSIRGVVLGHLARTKMLWLLGQFGAARLLEDVVELVYMGYPLSVIGSLVRSLPCSRVTRCERGSLFVKNRMVLYFDMDPKQMPQSSRGTAHRRRSGGRKESGCCRGSSVGKSTPGATNPSRRRRGGRMRRVRAARKFLEKFDLQYQQLKEEAKRRERTVELQEQAEVFAQVSFRRSGVIRNEFIPSHCEEFGQCRLVVAFCELLLAVVVE